MRIRIVHEDCNGIVGHWKGDARVPRDQMRPENFAPMQSITGWTGLAWKRKLRCPWCLHQIDLQQLIEDAWTRREDAEQQAWQEMRSGPD